MKNPTSLLSSNMQSWVAEEGLNLPDPVDVGTLNDIMIEGKSIKVGIGIHDSSSSLAPYFSINKGKFLLISTGTWCINMNPFNAEILTSEQLDHDCLCYMSITRQPVKSSRLFLGHLHEISVNQLSAHFNTSNATALGAALVIRNTLSLSHKPVPDLGLNQC